MYPNGDGSGKGNSLSLYLLSESNEKVYVRAKLRVLDQVKSNHAEKLGQCFTTIFDVLYFVFSVNYTSINSSLLMDS